MKFLTQRVHGAAGAAGDETELQYQYLIDAALEGFFTHVRGMFTSGTEKTHP
ncbi:hypothetical protein D3C71_2205850 [compost metagenome]